MTSKPCAYVVLGECSRAYENSVQTVCENLTLEFAQKLVTLIGHWLDFVRCQTVIINPDLALLSA